MPNCGEEGRGRGEGREEEEEKEACSQRTQRYYVVVAFSSRCEDLGRMWYYVDEAYLYGRN